MRSERSRRALAGLMAVAATLAGAPPAALAQGKSGTIGAAPVGGAYFVWGGGFAKLLNESRGWGWSRAAC